MGDRGRTFVVVGALVTAAVAEGACGSDGEAGPVGSELDSGAAEGGTLLPDGATADGAATGALRICVLGSIERVSAAPGESLRAQQALGASGRSAVVWDDARTSPDARQIFFAALDGAGKASAEVSVTAADNPSQPRIAWSGSEWAVAWARHDRIRVQRMSASGDRVGAVIEHLAPTTYSAITSMVAVPGGYALAFSGTPDPASSTHDLHFAKLDAAGALVGSIVKVSSSLYSEERPALAWNGNGYGLTWQDTRDGDEQIYFRTLDASGKANGDEIRVSDGAGETLAPAIVWTGSGYGVAWRTSVQTTSRYDMAHLDARGNVIHGPTAVSPPKGTSQWLDGPALAWDGAAFAVAFSWANPGNGAQLTERNVDLSPRSTTVHLSAKDTSFGGRQPSILATADGYRVAWSGAPAYDVFAAQVRCK